MTADCPTCGAAFEVSKDRKRFCSWQCRSGAARTERTCDGCGGTFTSYRSDPQAYCTRVCYKAHRPTQVAEWVNRTCQVCGVEMQISGGNAQKLRRKYCSRKCLGVANGRRAAGPRVRVVKNCKTCGTEMRVIPSLAERKTTCSRKCNALQAFANSRPRTSKIADDSILAWAEMDLLGSSLDWRPEYRVSRWTIDLAFPDRKWAIELDGSYWHGREDIAAKDAVRDAALASLGWSTYRIVMSAGETPEFIGTRIAVAVMYLMQNEGCGPLLARSEGRQAVA